MERLVDVRVTAMIVEILLGFYGFNMDIGAELTMVDADIDVQKGDVGGGSGQIATVELFQESSEGVRPMCQSETPSRFSKILK